MRTLFRKSASHWAVILVVLASPFVGSGAKADVLIGANSITTPPVMNGTVNPADYGGGPAFSADFSNLNASNPSRLSSFLTNMFVTRSNASYSYDLYAAYTTTTLYFGFVVRDQFVSLVSTDPVFNSDIELFIGGNRTGNNFQNFGAVASKQAFQIVSDAAGDKFTAAGGAFANGDWSVVASPVTSAGYSLQFAIPLNLIDTHENGVFTPAHAGSLLRFNVGGVKNDRLIANQDNYSVLFQNVPFGNFYPSEGVFAPNGTLLWAADLSLNAVPEPSPLLLAGAGAALVLAGALRRCARARRA
jgi:hypothetical protein